MGTPQATAESARAGGWHVWTGQLWSGEEATVILCPDHAGNLPRQRPAPVMENQEALW